MILSVTSVGEDKTRGGDIKRLLPYVLIVRKEVITVRRKNYPTCLYRHPRVSASGGGSNS